MELLPDLAPMFALNPPMLTLAMSAPNVSTASRAAHTARL